MDVYRPSGRPVPTLTVFLFINLHLVLTLGLEYVHQNRYHNDDTGKDEGNVCGVEVKIELSQYEVKTASDNYQKGCADGGAGRLQRRYRLYKRLR